MVGGLTMISAQVLLAGNLIFIPIVLILKIFFEGLGPSEIPGSWAILVLVFNVILINI